MGAISFDVSNRSLLEDFSNAEGGNSYVNQESINESLKLAQALAANNAAKKALEAATGCKKPVINLFKKKKAYEQCLADSAAKKAAAEAEAKRTELLLAQARIEEAKANNRSVSQDTSDKKFLGMDQTTAVVLGVLGLGLLAIGGYVLVKKIGK